MPSPKYKVSLQLDKTIYSQSAATIVEALDKLEVQKVTAKGIITVTFKQLSAQAVLYPLMLRKLINNNVSKVLFQKRMLGALK